jgi:hypothetical protein
LETNVNSAPREFWWAVFAFGLLCVALSSVLWRPSKRLNGWLRTTVLFKKVRAINPRAQAYVPRWYRRETEGRWALFAFGMITLALGIFGVTR